MDKEIIYGGVIIPPFDPADYVAGANSPLKLEQRNTTRDWLQFFSEAEKQTMVWGDTMGCVTFTSVHHLVATQFNWMLANNLWPKESVDFFNAHGYIVNGKFELSERFIVSLSGTSLVGNSAQNVLQAIRKFGVVPESICPNDGPTSRAEYFAISDKAKALGMESLKYFSGFWQAIPKNLVNDYLVQAPVMIFTTVCPGWGSDPVVKACVGPVQHATAIYDVNDKSGVYEIYDQYAPFEKQLAKDYPLDFLFQFIVYPTPQGPDVKPYIFNKNINQGQKIPGEVSAEVLQLQKRLTVPPSSVYDENTRITVLAYQINNLVPAGLASIWELVTLWGRAVGPKTRKILNAGVNNVVTGSMDTTFSVTQGSNIAIFVGLIVMLAKHFGFNLPAEDVAQTIGAIVALVGVITSWINRYSKGDLTISGVRK